MTGYRFGFALTTALGNQTRYVNLRKYADRDPEVEATWAPITHHLDPDPYARWPGAIHHQLVLNHQAAAVVDRWASLDAVVVHAFQLFAYLSLRRRRDRGPVLALYQDYAPFRDPAVLQQYGQDVRDDWRRRGRFQLQSWFTRRADLCVAWTQWAARSFIDDCDVDPGQVHVVNPGVDLELWPAVPAPPGRDRRLRVLFVGGDFARKGGELLLDAYGDLSAIAELDIVTRQPPAACPAGVRVHTGVEPNDGTLRELFRRCDIVVLPTYAEMAGLVLIEAMATGRPVVATSVGGIPDLVDDGVTGVLIEAGDRTGLIAAIRQLAWDPARREAMGRAGRARVQARFDAAVNAARLIEVLKDAVDARRADSHDRPTMDRVR